MLTKDMLLIMNYKSIFLMALSILAIVSCAGSVAVEEGVSKELAVSRKQAISDVEYNLFFDIPEAKSDPIKGKEIVTFNLSCKQMVQLDFRENGIESVSVNGKESSWHWEKEHLVLGRRALKKGKNEVVISFTPSDQSFNRNDEYLYTLVVPERARTVYPCFDQPDMKARFTLTLEIPESWVAVSAVTLEKETISDGRKTVIFSKTPPASTYLFSFVAGKWQVTSYEDSGKTYHAYYRETDPAKVEQFPEIFKEVTSSIKWLEDYTGTSFPWPKYDFVVIPGFQYGGMEHIGATQYNESTIFLGPTPTADERYKRIELIAHETAHMWFGDLVTMAWFDDVWTKEVFASYFAAEIAQPLFTEINHSLNWLKSLTAPSMTQDRTEGTTSIQQELPNLSSAGLVYNNIIYDKAPVMMKKLVELMGKDAFREGIREYINTYQYSNATWDDLVRILSSKTDKDIVSFSQVWVHEKGMPEITFNKEGNQLTITQTDPYSRGLVWPQNFRVGIFPSSESLDVTFDGSSSTWTATVEDLDLKTVLPSIDGKAYGALLPDSVDLDWLIDNWNTREDDLERYSLLMTVYENYLHGRIDPERFLTMLVQDIQSETDQLTASTLSGYLGTVLSDLAYLGKDTTEEEKILFSLTKTHPLPSCRLQILRSLISNVSSQEVIGELYDIWENESIKGFTDSDYMSLSYELSIRLPEQSEEILSAQRARLDGSNPDRKYNRDRLRQFDFISRFAVPSSEALDEAFESLLEAEGRRMEPWAASSMRLMMHPQRGSYPNKYIRPSLDALKDVQRTGDIFFPANWCSALLGSERSPEAKAELDAFLKDNPDYPQLLKNKIMLAAYNLQRFNR